MVLISKNNPTEILANEDITVYVPIEKYNDKISIYGHLISIDAEKLPKELTFNINKDIIPSIEEGKNIFRAEFVCGTTPNAGKICQMNTFFAGSFRSKKYNKNYMNNYLVKGIIPKNSKYYIGELLYGENGEIGIFPNKIIVMDEIVN